MQTPQLISRSEIDAAAERIADGVRRTPLVGADALGRPSAALHLKAESLQLGGSFKIRGALNALSQLSHQQRSAGVVTHSSGNHAQGVARAAAAFGVRATIVMPNQTPEIKRRATQALGAEVILVDASQRQATVDAIRLETGAAFISPFDDRAVIAGQGTVGREIVADLGDVSSVWVPVSGGGLVSGVAAAVKSVRPGVRVIAVEPELAGDLAEGFASGHRVSWEASRTGRTIADGLRVQSVGELNWLHIQALVDDVVVVSEEEIRSAMRDVMLGAKLVCEPSGAVAVAGYRRHVDRCPPGPAVAVVSGGNVDAALMCEVLASPP